MTAADVNILFRNFRDIYSLHRAFLTKMEESLLATNDSGSTHSCTKDTPASAKNPLDIVFRAGLSPFSRVTALCEAYAVWLPHAASLYVPYLAGHGRGTELAEKLQINSLHRDSHPTTPLQQFIFSAQQSSPMRLAVGGYLCMPLGRIPRYLLLLRELDRFLLELFLAQTSFDSAQSTGSLITRDATAGMHQHPALNALMQQLADLATQINGGQSNKTSSTSTRTISPAPVVPPVVTASQ